MQHNEREREKTLPTDITVRQSNKCKKGVGRIAIYCRQEGVVVVWKTHTLHNFRRKIADGRCARCVCNLEFNEHLKFQIFTVRCCDDNLQLLYLSEACRRKFYN